jgi:hypothetical protein
METVHTLQTIKADLLTKYAYNIPHLTRAGRDSLGGGLKAVFIMIWRFFKMLQPIISM